MDWVENGPAFVAGVVTGAVLMWLRFGFIRARSAVRKIYRDMGWKS